MFSIIISEKGGAERRETFDKNEINVGRVQGNDLMLPKGNVSKHHARLLYRDGRFIVTDLKSTNGTYVNGRKIAQATIVREGDKIYIGDFVLRLDAGSAADAQVAPDDESVRTLARNNAGASQQQQAQPAPAAMAAPAPAQRAPQPMQPVQPMMGASGSAAYDREPEDDIPPAPPPKAAPAPRPAQANNAAARGQTLQISGNQRPQTSAQPMQRTSSAAGPAPMAQQPIPQAPPPQAQQQQQQPSAVPPVAATSPAAQVPANLAPAVVLPVAPARVVPRETPQQAARKLALITLVDRIADAVDLAPLKANASAEDGLSQQIERAAREQAHAMRTEDEIPEGIDVDQLVADALRELIGLGAIGAMLEDDEVSEIQCVRNDQVLAVRGGQFVLADASFTSDEALGRVITRLAIQSGEPVAGGERVIERRLPRGAHLIAVAPPAASSHALVIRKRRRVDATLEDLVRSGAMSRPMAVFLDACVQARANVIASAPAGTSTALLVAALASAAPPGERIALLGDVDEITVSQALVFSLSLADRRPSACEEVVRAAARMHPDRMIVSSLPTGACAPLVEAIAEGAEGVIAAGAAPSLRQLMARLTSQLVLSRAGLDGGAARDCVADAFDVALEMTTLADGRPRIVRIAEVGTGDGRGARDLFVWTPDASGEGTFGATGVLPHRAQADFAARGVKLDATMFKRGR